MKICFVVRLCVQIRGESRIFSRGKGGGGAVGILRIIKKSSNFCRPFF